MKTGSLLCTLITVLLLGSALNLFAQDRPVGKEAGKANAREQVTSDAKTKPTKENSKGLRYIYEFNQPEFFTNHIVIEHDSKGLGQLTFTRKQSDESLTDPIQLSSETLSRILSLWEALHFLDSNTQYQSPKEFPHLGTMTLEMVDGERSRKVEFNWTNDPNAKELTNEYRRISNQATIIFDIRVARDNMPLEVPKLIDALESLLNRNELSDKRGLKTFLEELSTDERIPLIGRNKAGKLLKKLGK
jgi:hypothetical protein